MTLPARNPFHALRHRNFRLFFSGQFISLVGTWMQVMAQGWLVLELSNSAFLVGLVTSLEWHRRANGYFSASSLHGR